MNMTKDKTIKVQIDFTLEEYETIAQAAKGVGLLKSGSGHVQRLIRAVLAGRIGVNTEDSDVNPDGWIAPVGIADVVIGNPRWPERKKPPVMQGF